MRAIMPTRSIPGTPGNAALAFEKALGGKPFPMTVTFRCGKPSSINRAAAASELHTTMLHQRNICSWVRYCAGLSRSPS